jgi:hypothetical protein
MKFCTLKANNLITERLEKSLDRGIAIGREDTLLTMKRWWIGTKFILIPTLCVAMSILGFILGSISAVIPKSKKII